MQQFALGVFLSRKILTMGTTILLEPCVGRQSLSAIFISEHLHESTMSRGSHLWCTHSSGDDMKSAKKAKQLTLLI